MARRLLLLLALAACRSQATATRPSDPPPAPPPAGEPVPPIEPAPAADAAPAPPSEDTMDDPPLSRSILHVSFQVDPVVGEHPPTLVVSVRNPTAQTVPFVRFADTRCFAFHHLGLQITRKGKPVALAPCVVKDWPGVVGSLAAGAEERVVLPFAELAASWPHGTYAIAVHYDPGELERSTSTTAAHASQSSLNTESFTIARPLKQFRVAARKSVTLPDGVILEFGGHSHKSIGPGQTSPLIVGGKITVKGGKPDSFYASLYPPASRLFTLADGRVFELVDYAYDEWMDLRYYGKIAPARP
jgi:hypothetical protein